MSPILSLAALLLAAVPTLAWDTPNYCASNSDSVSSLLHPSQSFNASAYCSQFLGPTTYIHTILSTTTLPLKTLTSVTRTTTSTTSTNTLSSTLTALCPTSTSNSNLQCNISGNGNSNNLISYKEPLDAISCHQQCLAMNGVGMEECKSFQIVNDNGVMRCNFYNGDVETVGFPDGREVAFLFDRGCGDLLPAGCSVPAPAATTAAPDPPAALIKRDDIPFPTFLHMGAEALYILCSCVVTSANPTKTIIQSDTLSVNSYTSVTRVVTNVVTLTQNPNWSTVYTSAS